MQIGDKVQVVDKPISLLKKNMQVLKRDLAMSG